MTFSPELQVKLDAIVKELKASNISFCISLYKEGFSECGVFVEELHSNEQLVIGEKLLNLVAHRQSLLSMAKDLDTLIETLQSGLSRPITIEFQQHNKNISNN